MIHGRPLKLRGPKDEPYFGLTPEGFPSSTSRRPAYGHDEKGKPVHGYNAAGQPICGRKINGESRVCQSTILCDNGRCKARGHGGNNTIADVEQIARATSRRDDYMRGLGLAEKFQKAIKDPELISHRENAAMLDALISAELEGSLPPAELWAQAKALYATATKDGNAQALIALGGVLEQGIDSANRIDRAVKMAGEQRKHIEAEVRRESELQTTMDVRQATAFVMSLAEAQVVVFAELLKQAKKLGVQEMATYILRARERLALETERRLR